MSGIKSILSHSMVTREEENKREKKGSLHKAGSFLVQNSTYLLSIRLSAPCTKPISRCQSILQQADPAKHPPKFSCLEAPTRLVGPYRPQLECAGNTSMQLKSSMRQGKSCGGRGIWTTIKPICRSSYHVSAEVVERSHFSFYLSRKSSLLLRRHNYVSRAFNCSSLGVSGLIEIYPQGWHHLAG